MLGGSRPVEENGEQDNGDRGCCMQNWIFKLVRVIDLKI